MRPTSEIYLPAEMPNNCDLFDENQNAVRIFFDTNRVSLLDLKVFDDLRGFSEQFLLILFSGELWTGKYFRNFHNNIGFCKLRI